LARQRSLSRPLRGSGKTKDHPRERIPIDSESLRRWVPAAGKIFLCHRAILAVGDQKQPFPLPINMADILYFQAILLHSIKFIFYLPLSMNE
jgi:hypothetical protein